jgi:hypothetical protein
VPSFISSSEAKAGAGLRRASGAGAFGAGLVAAFLVLTAVHESMLRHAGHLPAMVDDEPLWCVERRKVESLGPRDVLLLGASRMQTDIDEATMTRAMPGRRVVNLAISSGGTSLPVFHDIVDNTTFAGTLVIDETERTMASDGIEQSFVDAYRHSFSFDRLLNRQADTWLQQRLVCLGPGESCTEFWPRLIARRRPSPPQPTVTSAHRFTRSDYTLADPVLLEQIRRGRLSGGAMPEETPRTTDAVVSRWLDLVNRFRSRGGQIIFVRLPVSEDRWTIEDAGGTATRTWQAIMKRLEVPSILCNSEDDDLRVAWRILDHSHLQASDTPRFTAWLCHRLQQVE